MATRVIQGVAVEIEGSGMPVVCIHGLGSSSNVWTPLAGTLARFRQVRIDLPFCGRSASPTGAADLDTLTSAVRAVIEELDVPRAHFVGHSMGAMVCLALAVQAPARVASLALFAPLAGLAEVARPGLRARADAARAGGAAALQQIADQAVAGTLAAATRRSRPVAASFVRESLMRQDPAGYAAMCDILAGQAPLALDPLDCPVLLVGGDEDPIAPPAALRALAARLRQPLPRTLRECGHWPTVERPDHCAIELDDFWRRLAH
jgi:pimeloyl-ACP methyl ester carboxylesterase